MSDQARRVTDAETLAYLPKQTGTPAPKAITRAQWLASHPPISPACPHHEKEILDHFSLDRIDVFRCKTRPMETLLWGPHPGQNSGPGILSLAIGELPALEELI